MNQQIRNIAVIGAGVIGASWAALFLAHGYNVTVVDPAPNAENGLRNMVESAWPSLVEVANASTEIPHARLHLVTDLKAAISTADFIQENGPENLEFKQALYRQLDEFAPAHALIASSSSGLKMSDIQGACEYHPERTLIAHPFNPPHLLPLVELVAGKKTSQASVDSARTFYEGIGKQTITVNKEVIGHVANRIQAALFREVTHLVKEGVVSAKDADAAVRFGPGLRWSVMGQCMLYGLGAGDRGIEVFLERFSPSINAWWEDLGKPTLDDETKAVLVNAVNEEIGDRSLSDLAHWRDTMLISRLTADAKSAKL